MQLVTVRLNSFALSIITFGDRAVKIWTVKKEHSRGGDLFSGRLLPLRTLLARRHAHVDRRAAEETVLPLVDPYPIWMEVPSRRPLQYFETIANHCHSPPLVSDNPRPNEGGAVGQLDAIVLDGFAFDLDRVLDVALGIGRNVHK